MSDTVSILADEREIGRLVLNYARGADTRDGDLFASVFVEDGVLELDGRETAGRHRLGKIPGLLNAYAKTYHMVHNTYITVDGDTATGEIYSASHHLRPIEHTAMSDRVMYITYRDSYVRTAEGWRIARRKVEVEFIEYKPVSSRD